MNRKDRIAVVVSALYLLFPVAVLVSGDPAPAVVFCAPVILYWGYRFIKGDISFIRGGQEDET